MFLPSLTLTECMNTAMPHMMVIMMIRVVREEKHEGWCEVGKVDFVSQSGLSVLSDCHHVDVNLVTITYWAYYHLYYIGLSVYVIRLPPC